MLSIHQRCRRVALALLAAAGAAVAPAAHAVTYALKAAQYLEVQPDGSSVAMWGYLASAALPDSTAVGAAAVNTIAAATSGFTSPGPALVVPPGDPTLRIILINSLPAGGPAPGRVTSIVVHGLINGSNPVFATNPRSGATCTPGTGPLATQRACRMRSLAAETPNGTAAASRRIYTFDNVPPGTYLYQSGTHQQVQVQMGLYGMMNKDAPLVGTQRHAYGSAGAQTAPFESETRLIFSEIDVAMHALIASNTLTTGINNYQPGIFRLHSYTAPTTGDPVVPTRLSHVGTSNQVLNINPAQRQLIRMANAGLTTRVPALRDGHMTQVAEDAKPYPYAREESVALLSAAKTVDAVVTPALTPQAAASPNVGEREIVLYDRRAGLVTAADGRVNGDFVRLRLATAATPPTLSLTGFAATANQGALYTATATATGTAPLTFSLVQAPPGMTINAATGTVSWTPSDAQAQKPSQPTLTHPVTVLVTAGNGGTQSGTVNIAVIDADDLATANPDTYTVTGGLTSVAAPGVMANDGDPDGSPVSNPQLVGAPSLPTDSFALAADGSVALDVRNQTWFRAIVPTASRTLTFNYTVQSPSSVPPNTPLTSLPGTVTMIVRGHQPPVGNEDAAPYTLDPARPFIYIPVLANDVAEAGWSVVPGTLARVGTAGSAGGQVNAWNPVSNSACSAAATQCVMRYRPAVGAVRGTETFSYRVKDNFGLWSNVVRVTVNIQ